MENINEYKKDFIDAYNAIPEERKTEIKALYESHSDESFYNKIIRQAKQEAQNVIDYADRRGYGYGEVGYNLNEEVKDFAEEVPELEKQYSRLLHTYFDILIETKEI